MKAKRVGRGTDVAILDLYVRGGGGRIGHNIGLAPTVMDKTGQAPFNGKFPPKHVCDYVSKRKFLSDVSWVGGAGNEKKSMRKNWQGITLDQLLQLSERESCRANMTGARILPETRKNMAWGSGGSPATSKRKDIKVTKRRSKVHQEERILWYGRFLRWQAAVLLGM